jgi:cell division protein FtsQ
MRSIGRNKNKKGPVLMLLVLIIALTLLVILGTSYFVVSDIVVEDSAFLSRQQILELSGIKTGTNIFMVKLSEAEGRIEAHPFVMRADVSRELPNRITISVEERQLVGYLPFMGSYLLVDDEATVISATPDTLVENIPVFGGLQVKDFEIDRAIAIENRAIFDKIIYISKNITKFMARYSPVHVDISDPESIVLSVADRFKIRLGDTDDLDYKLKYGCTILEKLFEQSAGGEIDVSESGKAFFRPW